jgi:hypothetical protein
LNGKVAIAKPIRVERLKTANVSEFGELTGRDDWVASSTANLDHKTKSWGIEKMA